MGTVVTTSFGCVPWADRGDAAAAGGRRASWSCRPTAPPGRAPPESARGHASLDSEGDPHQAVERIMRGIGVGGPSSVRTQ